MNLYVFFAVWGSSTILYLSNTDKNTETLYVTYSSASFVICLVVAVEAYNNLRSIPLSSLNTPNPSPLV